jgi:hypothetical protein
MMSSGICHSCSFLKEDFSFGSSLNQGKTYEHTSSVVRSEYWVGDNELAWKFESSITESIGLDWAELKPPELPDMFRCRRLFEKDSAGEPCGESKSPLL